MNERTRTYIEMQVALERESVISQLMREDAKRGIDPVGLKAAWPEARQAAQDAIDAHEAAVREWRARGGPFA